MLSRILKFFRRHPEVRYVHIPTAESHELTLDEKRVIRAWLEAPTTKRVLGLMEAKHPGTLTSRIGKHARSEWDQLAAVNYLNRIAGWESFRNDLLNICETHAATTSVPEDLYPSQ